MSIFQIKGFSTVSLGSKIGRVLVYSDSDLPTAYGLATQMQLAPLSSN
jgi:hypothetical protein